MMAQQAKMLTVNPDKLSSIIGILMLKRDLISKSDLLSSMCAQMHGCILMHAHSKIWFSKAYSSVVIQIRLVFERTNIGAQSRKG